MIRNPSHRTQQGISLIELMVTMLLGLFLMTGLFQVYQTNKNSFRLQEASSQVQRNGQFALDIISQRINSSGYTGFYGNMATGVENLLKTPNNQLWDITKPLIGFDNVTSGKNIAGITGFVSGSDVLLVKQMEQSRFIKSNPSSSLITLDKTDKFSSGDILLIADIDQASLFQANAVSTAGGQTKIAITLSSVVTPGNQKQLSYAYGTDAEIGKLSVKMYYLKPGKNKRPALYEAVLANKNSKIALEEIELASNIEDFQLTFGEDTNGDRVTDKYVKASGIADWNHVISVGVALLSSSNKSAGGITQKAYQFDPDTFSFVTRQEGSAHTLQKPFRSVSSIRNRAL